jgi:hypothetical protein
MLAKTKHKKIWKFYWNPFCCLGRVMDNATVSSLCVASRLCKSTLFPFDSFSYKKKTQIIPPPNIFPVLIKFDTHILLYPPLSSGRGVYSICPFVRECFPHCLCNSSLTTWWNLFFPRYTGVKKTQHYKLFISNPIVLFWRTKKKTQWSTKHYTPFKDWATRTPLKTRGELICPGK